eukprot:scaffold155787_cov29-Tisochrysis_lutea.AAC.3
MFTICAWTTSSAASWPSASQGCVRVARTNSLLGSARGALSARYTPRNPTYASRSRGGNGATP